jgi:hypothetical protein
MRKITGPSANLRFFPFHSQHPLLFLFIPKLSPSPMSQRPKREAVANRDDTETLLNLQKRRTPAEVQREKELAASAKAAANAQKAATAAEIKRRVAAFEDLLRKEDQEQERKMSRPDLVGAGLVMISTLAANDPLKEIFAVVFRANGAQRAQRDKCSL